MTLNFQSTWSQRDNYITDNFKSLQSKDCRLLFCRASADEQRVKNPMVLGISIRKADIETSR